MLPSNTNDVVLEKGEEEQERAHMLEPLHQVDKASLANQALRWAYQTVRPSILNEAPSKPVKIRRTAYLDGIRGFAALMVYFGHHQLWAHEANLAELVLQSGYGAFNRRVFATLPWIRTFFSGGHMSVSIFFVISGYVLSAKSLAQLHAGDATGVGDSVGSALFRRWFRLWIPIVVVGLNMIFLYHWFGILAGFQPEPTLGRELWKFYTEFKNYTFIFGQPKTPWFSYHPHTWTIPTEFKASCIIYMACISFARATQRARLICEGALIFYFMYITDGAHYAMFMAGMLLCDLDMILAKIEQLPSWLQFAPRTQQIIFHVMFVVGVYLGGVPSAASNIEYLRDQPGWYWMSYLKPQAVFDFKWFFLFWAAILIVTSVQRIGWAKRFFETRFCLYLGHISYMLYLLHGPVLWTLGDRLYAAVGWSRPSHALVLPGWINRFPLAKIGPLGLELSFWIPNIILLPFTLWLAEIGTTMIDTPSIKFGQWLYNITLAPKPVRS